MDTLREAMERLPRPNPEMTWLDFLRTQELWNMINGETLAVFARGSDGNIEEVWPINPRNVVRIPSPDDPWITLHVKHQIWYLPEADVVWTSKTRGGKA